MTSFNLVDERWIPIRFSGGNREEVGIHDALLQSKGIAAIEGSSPLVVAALHRFLVAVLYRALEGPSDIDQAKALFRTGLPSERISHYLEKWRNRFYLFDDTYPFSQIPSFEPKSWRAWPVLAAEHNADNAKVLFDHIDIVNAGAVSPAAAARWLLAAQTFSVSAGKSELTHTGTAPSATAAMVVPCGRNLEDTFLFLLVPQNREVLALDIPLWERDPETIESLKQGLERTAMGLADLYSWRTRSVRFRPGDTSVVGSLAFASGVNFVSGNVVDSMVGYRIDETKGKLPVQFRDRGLWRDFDSLLPDDDHLAPRVIEHAMVLARTNNERFPRAVLVLGQSNNKAKIEYWRMERFALPEALSGDRNIRAEIKALLVIAEEIQKSLWSACRIYAQNLLSRGGREPPSKDINNFVGQMAVITSYWSYLESKFHEILMDYTLERDSDDIRVQWLKSIKESVIKAWNRHRMSISTSDIWSIRALVKAEWAVFRKIGELDEEIRKYEP